VEGDKRYGNKVRIRAKGVQVGGKLYGDMPEVRDQHQNGLQMAEKV
jgi:hypothetical protein